MQSVERNSLTEHSPLQIKMVLTDFPFFKMPFFSDVAHKSATNKGRARQLQSIHSSIEKELGTDSTGETDTK